MTRQQRTTRRLCVLACAATVLVASCSSPARTATNFCRQLQQELPGIAQPTATAAEVTALVDHYTRLLEVAPLAVRPDWTALTELVQAAANVDAADPASVQSVADLAYKTQTRAAAAAKWVRETCGVDIALGVGATP